MTLPLNPVVGQFFLTASATTSNTPLDRWSASGPSRA